MPAYIEASASPRHHQIEQIADAAVRLQRVPQPPLRMDHITILPPNPFSFQISRLFEFCDDPLHRSLRDTDGQSHLTKRLFGITGQANQYMCMIGQKIPTGRVYL